MSSNKPALTPVTSTVTPVIAATVSPTVTPITSAPTTSTVPTKVQVSTEAPSETTEKNLDDVLAEETDEPSKESSLDDWLTKHGKDVPESLTEGGSLPAGDNYVPILGGHITLDKAGTMPFQCFIHSGRAHVPPGRVDSVKKKMAPFLDQSLFRIVHATYPTYPWNVDEDVKAKSFEDIKNTLKICKYLKMKYFLIHLPHNILSNFEQVVVEIAALWKKEKAEEVCLILEPIAAKPNQTHTMSDNIIMTMKEVSTIMRKHFNDAEPYKKETSDIKTEVKNNIPDKTTTDAPAKAEVSNENPSSSAKLSYGWCVDTAHIFLRGVKLSYEEDVKNFLTEMKGLPIICYHLNGAKEALGSGKDHHAICMSLTDSIWGEVNSGLKYLLRNQKVPFILERDDDVPGAYKREIDSLLELVKKN